MKRISTFLAALALCCSAFAQTRTDSLLNILHDKDSQYVFVVSHRGATFMQTDRPALLIKYLKSKVRR